MTLSAPTCQLLEVWTGHHLDANAQSRLEQELTRLSAEFAALTPIPFEIQAHDFTQVLKDLADEF